MNKESLLIERLDQIGKALQNSEHALALLALGSCGAEIDRLDAYSDLDFFVIVEDGYKQHYIKNLVWLSCILPLGYVFKNTVDGYKAMFVDGIFCEFAVFEVGELSSIPFAMGRLVWQQPTFDSACCQPKSVSSMDRQSFDVNWAVGEALTNLYVGLMRYKRGEKLSAYKFVQNYAVDRIGELIIQGQNARPANIDPFDYSRRFELRYPTYEIQLGTFIQGYEKTPESAREILMFLEAHFDVNPWFKERILQLL